MPPIICPSLELCQIRCAHGLLKNRWGCFECKCASGAASNSLSTLLHIEHPTIYFSEDDRGACELLTVDNCGKQCPHGYLTDVRGCALCKCAKCAPVDNCYKQCLYGFRTNLLGCPVCKCKGNFHPKFARELIPIMVPARNGVEEARLSAEQKLLTKESSCFFNSSGDSVETHSLTRDSGEWWTDEAHCRQCFCQNKKVGIFIICASYSASRIGLLLTYLMPEATSIL